MADTDRLGARGVIGGAAVAVALAFVAFNPWYIAFGCSCSPCCWATDSASSSAARWRSAAVVSLRRLDNRHGLPRWKAGWAYMSISGPRRTLEKPYLQITKDGGGDDETEYKISPVTPPSELASLFGPTQNTEICKTNTWNKAFYYIKNHMCL